MKKHLLALLATAALAMPALAQQATAAADMTDGVVRKIDKDTKKVTIKHDEIKNLQMPPMTMVFQVKDSTLLDKVQAGDKVRFRAEMAGTAMVVTDISAAK